MPFFRRLLPLATGLIPSRQAWNRGFCLFFGLFALLNVLGEWRRAGFDANEWWIMLPGAPAGAVRILLLACSLPLLGYAVKPAMGTFRAHLTRLTLGFLLMATLWNGAEFYALLAKGTLRSGAPFPLSFVLSLCLAGVLAGTRKESREAEGRREGFGVGMATACWLLAFPLLQIVLFGKTDYARPAQAAVVFGARTYANGQPSDALADRVRTACDLYRAGTVRKLIFSGGDGDGTVHETEAMRRMAVSLGVRNEDILLDREGLNTRATVANLRVLMDRHGLRKVLAVSHFYHLPRVKMACHRAGFEVCTVPAKESYFLRQMPIFVMREVAAIWSYYLRPPA